MRERKFHILEDNKKNKQYNNIIFFDCEAYLEDVGDKTYHHFRMAWACYVRYDKGRKKEDWFFTKNKDELCNWILSKTASKRTLYILTHNIWYDLRVSGLINRLIEDKWQLKSFVCQSMQFILQLKKGNKAITCLNFAQYFPMKLQSIGKAIGLEKLEEQWQNEDDEACSIYCKRDVEILVKAWDLWRLFITEHDLGNQAFTLAGQAFNAFRHRFMTKTIKIHANKEIDKLELEAYYGGRTEAFYIGEVKETPIYYLDVNSLYPYVMKVKKYPVNLKFYFPKMTIKSLKRFLDMGFCAIARVIVNTNRNDIPKRFEGKLIFPVGRFETVLCTESLINALENNEIEEVKEVAIYDADYIFADYVDYFYALKLKYEKEGNKAMRLMTKLFLNSLYGKFGQRVDVIIREEDIDFNVINREVIIDADTGERCVKFSLFGKEFYVKRKADLGYNAFVGIAAHVTDYGRNYISYLRRLAGVENVYYMDTDSLFVNKKGYEKLKSFIGEELGKLKVEKVINNLIINGLKDYIADSEVKRKGIRKDAIQLADSLFEQVQFPKFWTDVSNGIDKPYATIKIQKELKRDYNKGIVTDSGKITPYVFY